MSSPNGLLLSALLVVVVVVVVGARTWPSSLPLFSSSEKAGSSASVVSTNESNKFSDAVEAM